MRVLALAILVLFVAAWVVLPAPTMWLLPLSVGAPEIGVPLALAAFVAAAISLLHVRAFARARVALLLSIIAIAFALSPLARFGSTYRDAEREMEAAMTTEYLQNLNEANEQLSESALDISKLLRPFTATKSTIAARANDFRVVGGDTLRMIVYQRDTNVLRPMLIQIYGGAWQRGNPSDFADFARRAAEIGFVVFAIDYRHAPQNIFPAQIEDVRAALEYAVLHAHEYRADTSKIVVMGRSAGAHLGMLAAYMPNAHHGIRGVISYYGPVDLVEGYRHPPSPDPLDVRATEETFLGGAPRSQLARYEAASPITYANIKQPPTLLIYGGRDHIVEPRFGRILRDSLRRSGTVVVHVPIPWADHAFDEVPNGPSGQLARFVTERFLLWAVRE